MFREKASKRNSVFKLAVCILVCIAAVFALSVSRPVKTKADVATDTISIRVGYLGMELSEYVEVATYHWSELMGMLPLNSQAYSYFQRNYDGVNYKAILDCANGFSISEILDISHIYVGDIYNIMFYVQDAQGIWTSFDYWSLFGERYYYPNIPSHRKIIYGTREVTTEKPVMETVPVTQMMPVTEQKEVITEDPVLDDEGNQVFNEDGTPKMEQNVTYEEVPVYNEDGTQKMEEVPVYNADGSPMTEEVPVYNEDGTPKMEVVTETKTDYSKILGYTFDEAYNFAVPVEPMLAIEDNWKSFNQDFENIYEDFQNMTTAHRFRLLFGQTSPTESLTHESASYVSALYITLSGMPSYGDITEGDKYGSNTVELEVSDLYNQDMTNSLSQYLNVDSTNENVIRIDRIATIGSDLYSDVSRVIVYYSVTGDGTASFSVGLGANGERKDYSSQANIVVENGQASFHNGPVNEEKPKDDNPPVLPGGEDPDNITPSGSQNTDSNRKDPDVINDVGKEVSTPEQAQILNGAYLLSDDITPLLSGNVTVVPEAKPDQNITQVRIEDNTKEKQEMKKIILLLTGGGVILLCVLGGLYEFFSFKYRLHKKLRYRGAEE